MEESDVAQRWGFLGPWCQILQHQVAYMPLRCEGKLRTDENPWESRVRWLQVALPKRNDYMRPQLQHEATFQLELVKFREALAVLAAVSKMDPSGFKQLLLTHVQLNWWKEGEEDLPTHLPTRFVLQMEDHSKVNSDIALLCGVDQRQQPSPEFLETMKRIAEVAKIPSDSPGLDVEIPVRVAYGATLSAPSSSEQNKAPSNTPMRDSFSEGVTPAFSSSKGARGGDKNGDARSVLVTPPKSTRLVPASQHVQKLDLTRAFANLELDDPMAVNRRGGRSVRTAAPATSIFSLNTPLSTNHTRSSSGSLLTFQRDASGAIVEVPDFNSQDKTSSTLPTGKSSPLYHPDLNDEISVKRASYPKTPMIWNQQLMKPVSTSPITTARLRRQISKERFNRRETGSSTDEDQDGDDMPPLLLGGQSPMSDMGMPLRGQGKTESVSSMSPLDIEIPEGDPVNYTLGVEQCGEREELFLDLLEKFTMGCEAAMNRIEDAYLAQDFALLKRESHSLKGSSAYVAALRVSKSAYRVQLASERVIEQRTGLEDLEPALTEMVNATMATLRREHKLLRGYIRRNFAFRSMRNPILKDDRSRDKQANACALM